MTIPLLIELGYKKDFATAIVAVAGGLGVIIPPSIPFIMYAMAREIDTGIAMTRQIANRIKTATADIYFSPPSSSKGFFPEH